MPINYFYESFENKESLDYERRCYPSASNIQVFKYRDNPSSYEIRASFKGIRGLIEEIKAPHHFNRIYCLRICSGAMFIDKSDKSFKRFMNYTVEQLGLLIEPELQKRGGVDAGYTLLEASDYLCLPIYWNERPDYRVQVWRTRIFDCPLADFHTSPSDPLGPTRPLYLYLEERWHPNTGKQRSLIWFSHRCKKGKKIDQFRRDALLILGDSKGLGRPKKYGNRNDFIRELKKAYEQVAISGMKDPTQPQVAEEMEISLLTFQRYLGEYNIPWPPRG